MITIITGQRNTGKTTWLEHRIMNMASVGGFLSPKRFMDGEFEGYDIYDVATGEVYPFLHYSPMNDPIDNNRIGPFVIDKGGLDSAIRIIEKAIGNRECHTIVLDEIGMAELEGRLFREILDSCLIWHDAERSLHMVVQERALEGLLALYSELQFAEIITIVSEE